MARGLNLKRNVVNPKFAPKREGPFKIMKVLSSTSYQLQIPGSWKIHPVFHSSLLTVTIRTLFSFFHTPISLLTHSSHDRVLISHAYLPFDSFLSRPCTFSHDHSTLTHDYPCLRNVYIDQGTRCKYPNLALLKYT